MRQIYAYLRLSFPSAFTWNSLVPSHGIVLYIALDSHDTASEMGLPWFRPVCVSTYFWQLFIFNFKYFVACLSRMNTFCILTFHTSKPRFPAIPSRVIWLSMSQSVPTSRNSWIEVPYFMNTFSPHFTRGRCTREWLPTWPSKDIYSLRGLGTGISTCIFHELAPVAQGVWNVPQVVTFGPDASPSPAVPLERSLPVSCLMSNSTIHSDGNYPELESRRNQLDAVEFLGK